jgi:hypothetical protein
MGGHRDVVGGGGLDEFLARLLLCDGLAAPADGVAPSAKPQRTDLRHRLGGGRSPAGHSIVAHCGSARGSCSGSGVGEQHPHQHQRSDAGPLHGVLVYYTVLIYCLHEGNPFM